MCSKFDMACQLAEVEHRLYIEKSGKPYVKCYHLSEPLSSKVPCLDLVLVVDNNRYWWKTTRPYLDVKKTAGEMDVSRSKGWTKKQYMGRIARLQKLYGSVELVYVEHF